MSAQNAPAQNVVPLADLGVGAVVTFPPSRLKWSGATVELLDLEPLASLGRTHLHWISMTSGQEGSGFFSPSEPFLVAVKN